MNIWITVVEHYGSRSVSLFDVEQTKPGCLPPQVARFDYTDRSLSNEELVGRSALAHLGEGDYIIRPGDVKNLWSCQLA
jgi:hypothetical protein